MYTSFYGLDELPFELSPNPKYLLLTARHREALANLQYGISARKSLTLLLGEAGTGKTTLLQAALASEACRGARIVHLENPTLTRSEFVEYLARSFGLSPEAMGSKATLLAELERELLAGANQGVTTALVIDEAHCLSRELLEEVRLLSNIETPGQKLLPLVLAAQPELADRLRLPSLVQLKQRVALRCTLGLLDASETRAYVSGRLKVAGANGREIFTRDAMQVIYERSGGVPRTISVICDNALVSGFAAEATVVDADMIREVCDDFDIRAPFSATSEAERPGAVVAETKGPPVAPVENLETVRLEQSPSLGSVRGNFRIVSLSEIRVRPGAPADVPESPPPGPAAVPHIGWLQGWSPEPPRARAVTAVTPVTPVTLIRPLTPSDRVLIAVVAVSAAGLLAVVLGLWRWSKNTVELTPSPVVAVADSHVSPPAPPTVGPEQPLTPVTSLTASPEPLVGVQQTPRAVATKSPGTAREQTKVRVQPHAKRGAHANRRPTPPRTAETERPQESVKPATPTPKATLAAVTPQPSTPQATGAATMPIEHPPARPAARPTASAPAAGPAAPAVAPPSDEQRIRGVLDDYQAAYEQLDPQAVETVWPSVDTRALARAFDSLSSQSIVFDRCAVSVAAATARAACQGGVEYVKRVGGGGTQSARREWVFDLQKSDDGTWRIRSLASH